MQTEHQPINMVQIGLSHQDLIGVRKIRRRRTITILSLIFLLLVTSIVCVALYESLYSMPIPQPHTIERSQINFESVLDGSYESRRNNASWISDNELSFRNYEGVLVTFNAETKITKPILSNYNMVEFSDHVEYSGDMKYLLTSRVAHKVFRHSAYSFYTLINVRTETHMPVKKDPLQLVKWSPKGNGYVYIQFNDIYYRPSADSLTEYRITTSGVPSIVFNGICDWIYEEEVFSSYSAIWFSPDGKKLAFVKFNDSLTNVMPIEYYGEPGSLQFQYPHMVNLHYPKPGKPNPIVSLHVVDLEETVSKNATTIKQLPLPNLNQPILAAVTWISNSELCATWMNRVQNQAHIFSCTFSNETCNMIQTYEKKNGWLDLFTAPLFSTDGSKMLLIYSQDQGGDFGDYSHLTLVDLLSQRSTALTKGLITVTDILTWDQETHFVYYRAVTKERPEHQNVYKVSDDPEQAPHEGECISCNLKTTNCLTSNAFFSPGNSYYLLHCYGPDIPEITLFDKEQTPLMVWEDNRVLKSLLRNVALPNVTFLNVPVADNMEARVELVLPPGMDTSGATKYPLLVNVYGGPGSHVVQDKYSISWNSYFCTARQVIIAKIDGRGSGLKGDKIMHAVYRKLGTVEIEDQIAVTRYLQRNFKFIDEKLTGIWGWSYGGYSTGMVLATDNESVFKCGVSVSPVTDWIYYDSIYTERYLGLPVSEDNLAGYKSSSLIDKSEKLANKTYLLIHGTFDDNVHFQQSLMLSRVLELQDIPFMQQIYTDENHSLARVSSHFYHTIEAFFMRCFS